jgi:hypothetical protein
VGPSGDPPITAAHMLTGHRTTRHSRGNAPDYQAHTRQLHSDLPSTPDTAPNRVTKHARNRLTALPDKPERVTYVYRCGGEVEFVACQDCWDSLKLGSDVKENL